ncbi:MAG: dihydrolipoamide acetyltransferase family protein [Thermaerobacter sp.]|nr:dihydrolipoamide acetyltransferase family protein [Thermaerobacter sp.]
MASLRLPKLGSTMDEGVIVAWKVGPGAHVEAGDVLYEVTTDKVNMEVEADFPCEVVRLLVAEGEAARVGQEVLEIKGGGTAEAGPAAVPPPVRSGPGEHRMGPLRASPAARRQARARGIDLATVVGTGPRGRIIGRDVAGVKPSRAPESAKPAGPPASGPARQTVQRPPSPPRETPGSGAFQPFRGVRLITAQRMTQSAQIPQVTLTAAVDMSHAVQAQKWFKTVKPDERVAITDFILLATVRAVARHPVINGWVEEAGFRPALHVDLGYAVDVSGDGLYVVCINAAEELGLRELAGRRRALTEAATSKRMRPDDLGFPSFTVSNLGMMGVESFNPLLNPPQAGILGIGAIVEQQGRPTVKLSLTFDHRAVDGAPAASILQEIRLGLEQPLWLL